MSINISVWPDHQGPLSGIAALLWGQGCFADEKHPSRHSSIRRTDGATFSDAGRVFDRESLHGSKVRIQWKAAAPPGWDEPTMITTSSMV
jgi:hypothetical protein